MKLRVAALALLAASSVALHIAAYLCVAGTARWLAAIGWTIAAVVAVAGLASGGRHVAPDFRRAWRFLLAGSACWLLGQVAMDVWIVGGASPPPFLGGELGWMLFAVFAIAGLYRFAVPRAEVRAIARIDLVAVVVASSAMIVAVLGPVLAHSGVTAAEKGVALAYPLLYCAVAVVLVETLAGASVLRSPAIWLILAGIALEAVAFTWWSPLLLHATYAPGKSPVDLLRTVGLLALGAGGFLAVGRNIARPAVEQVLRHRSAPPGLALFGLVGLLVFHHDSTWSVVPRVALGVGIAVVGVSLVVRAWVISRRYSVSLERERSANARLESANRELQTFSYSASHDLKAPLVSIQGFAGSLRRRSGAALDERSTLYLDRIESNAVALHQLIDRMLGSARLELQGARAPTIDTDEIARDVVREFRERHAGLGSGVHLVSSLPTVRAHPTRFRQALTNLVENAVKHAGGDAPPEVRISAIVRDGSVEIAVQDNGSGVALADQERIFHKFSRGRQPGNAPTAGIGLGLSLVKDFADASDGSIRYEPAPRGGSRFVLTLPKGTSA